MKLDTVYCRSCDCAHPPGQHKGRPTESRHALGAVKGGKAEPSKPSKPKGGDASVAHTRKLVARSPVAQPVTAEVLAPADAEDWRAKYEELLAKVEAERVARADRVRKHREKKAAAK